MIFTQNAKDEQNRQERTRNLLAAVKAGKLMSLILEPAGACNLSCSFCDLHSGRLGDMKKEYGIMHMDLYQQILDEIEELDFRFETIFFHGNGEPLLNKNFVEMVSLASKRNLAKKYVMYTNGTLMTPDIFDKLMASGMNEINVSLDTVDPDVYIQVKGKALLADVLDNIDYGIKRLRESPSMSLVIKCSTGGGAYGVNDDNLQKIIDKYTSVTIDSQYIHLKTVPIVEMSDGMTNQKKEYHTPCERLFYMAFIKFDGRVSPCCADVIDALNVGKIGDDRLKDIFAGQRLRDLREIHLSGNLNPLPFCKFCGGRTVVDLTDYRAELLALI